MSQLSDNVNYMKIKFIILFTTILLLASSCQTIKEKSEEVAEKENERLSLFIGKHYKELTKEMGNSTEDYVNEVGNLTLVYKTKKYGIPCERKFEVNTNGIIIGFTSSGCF